MEGLADQPMDTCREGPSVYAHIDREVFSTSFALADDLRVLDVANSAYISYFDVRSEIRSRKPSLRVAFGRLHYLAWTPTLS